MSSLDDSYLCLIKHTVEAVQTRSAFELGLFLNHFLNKCHIELCGIYLLCSYRSAMEEVLQRFGHIGDQIFEELDSQTLTKCLSVGRSWNLFLDQGKV